MARLVLVRAVALRCMPLSLITRTLATRARTARLLLVAAVLGTACVPVCVPVAGVTAALALSGPIGPAAIAGAGRRPAGDSAALARAFTGAWNAGQVERVVALFAEDAVVSQADVELTPYAITAAVTADDVYGTAMFLSDSAPRESEGVVVWAAGRAEVRAWVADLVRRHHVAEARGYRLVGPDGDRVRWEYRVFVDPYRQYRDVPPTEGTAELRIRAGEIAALTLTSTRASVRRRDEALLTAAVADTHRRAVARDAAPAPAGAPPTASRPRVAGRVTAGAAAPAILCITGLGALAAAVVGARQASKRRSLTDRAQRAYVLPAGHAPAAISLAPSGAARSGSAPRGPPGGAREPAGAPAPGRSLGRCRRLPPATRPREGAGGRSRSSTPSTPSRANMPNNAEERHMTTQDLVRRALLLQGGAAAATLALHRFAGPAHAVTRVFPSRPGEAVLPWIDQPLPNPVPEVVGTLPRWEQLDAYLTPADRFFTVAHYGTPAVDAQAWRLEVGGLVAQPVTLTLEDLRSRPRQEVTFTLECSGNHGLPFLTSAIGTARWAGTPLAPLLAEAGVLAEGREVVFWGADAGEEEVRDVTMRQHFARSLSLADASDPNVMLCYEMNGAPLPTAHGFPLRLIVPGWYGIANVKWLTRVEVRDTRLMNRFMARDYVTLREEPPGDEGGAPVWAETSVGRARLKSVPARVTRLGGQHRIVGAAWGAPIAGVEVQIDGGPWTPATLDRTPGEDAAFAWQLWSVDWGAPAPGEHAVTSRATDTAGSVQPAPDDPWLLGKHTYWESNGQVTRRVLVAPPGR